MKRNSTYMGTIPQTQMMSSPKQKTETVSLLRTMR